MKLLLVPLLLSQFRRGGRAQWAIVGFLAASIALLVASWVLVLTPGLEWRGKDWGVPVKNYILQSEIFAICAIGLIGQALELGRTHRRLLALLAVVAAAIFVANIGYVATSRTTLVVMAVLILLFGLRQFGWKGALAAFFLFRLFDVIKPYPANRLEQLHGGIGVMADDAMAAVYANLVLRAALYWLIG